MGAGGSEGWVGSAFCGWSVQSIQEPLPSRQHSRHTAACHPPHHTRSRQQYSGSNLRPTGGERPLEIPKRQLLREKDSRPRGGGRARSLYATPPSPPPPPEF